MIERTLQTPRGYKAPEQPMLMFLYTGAGPFLLVGVFVIGWGFGLYYLFTTRNWDALTRRLPIALCAVVVLQVGLQSLDQSSVMQSLLGVMAVTILLVGTMLPALSGVLLWIGRQSPARMWAAEQLTHGRVFLPTVSASLLDGVSGGAVIAAIAVLSDWVALQVPGFTPSISRELNVVDGSFSNMIGSTMTGAAFLVLGVAFLVEAFDRFKVNPIISSAVVAVAAGLFASTDQEHILPALAMTAGMAAAAAGIVVLYRWRGFLAAFVAGMVALWLTAAMALQSLEDPELRRFSNLVVAIVVGIAAAGAWGAGRRLLEKPAAVTSAP